MGNDGLLGVGKSGGFEVLEVEGGMLLIRGGVDKELVLLRLLLLLNHGLVVGIGAS